ncbi:glycosyltransferase family 2 protein [Puniceicoccaceae bacterium K14]|nr:glycosyltransferase family 2 protein [Puniceicoccaceae bacterium K14]
MLLESVRGSGISPLEVIIVDDFSTDGTRNYLELNWRSHADLVVYHSENLGKGAAVRSGIKAAKGEYVIIQDADNEYDPSEYRSMLNAIASEDVDIVYGSRFLHPDAKITTPFWHRFVNECLTRFSNLFTGLELTDMETCYKLIPSEWLDSIEIEEDRFGIEPELTAKLAARGARIKEVPISYNRRKFEDGKKIGVIDGFRAVYVILKYGLKYMGR